MTINAIILSLSVNMLINRHSAQPKEPSFLSSIITSLGVSVMKGNVWIYLFRGFMTYIPNCMSIEDLNTIAVISSSTSR